MIGLAASLRDAIIHGFGRGPSSPLGDAGTAIVISSWLLHKAVFSRTFELTRRTTSNQNASTEGNLFFLCSRGRDSVKSLRQATPLLALLALLLGNVAGWVHVGQHAVSSTGHSLADDRSQDADQAVRNGNCCQHSVAKPCGSSADSPASDSPANSSPPCGDHEHDADECATCQHFYQARQLIHLDSGCWSPDAILVVSLSLPVQPSLSATLDASSNYRRGPPLS